MNGIKQGSRTARIPSMENSTELPIDRVMVLTQQQYKVLEQKALSGMAVREDTTPIQAGMQLGVEHVLRILRTGFVVGG